MAADEATPPGPVVRWWLEQRSDYVCIEAQTDDGTPQTVAIIDRNGCLTRIGLASARLKAVLQCDGDYIRLGGRDA